ncbi:response regulator [candidate division KSB1 bacterium]|nr:response regulator [candidate division KSB1 bacterium]
MKSIHIDNPGFPFSTNLCTVLSLKMTGLHKNNDWNKKGNTLLLNIQPLNWTKNWILLIATFILIAIIYILYFTNLYNIKKRNIQLEEINENLNKEIIKRKRTEEELKEQKQCLDDIFQGVQEGIGIVDKYESIEYYNKAFADLFEYSMDYLKGKNLLELFPKETHSTILAQTQKRKKGEISSYVLLYITPRGEKKYMRVTISPRFDKKNEYDGAIGAVLDITGQVIAEEKRSLIEAQLRQSQKMETIGTLAGGIAHDFNNILVPIIGYTEMSLELLNDNHIIKSNLEKILKASKRAKDLIQQILTFSRHDKHSFENIEIHLLIKEALKLLRSSLPATIEIRENIDKNCGSILADPTQIHQVLMNLCTNAYHAMRVKGGILEITLEPVTIDEKTTIRTKGLQNGKNYILLSVKDTGEGMDEKTRERIFEPFFTTKRVGEGTGLGLSAVHGIVISHGGKITVESQVGKGSTFNVYLPRTDIKNKKSLEKVYTPLPKGHEHILFVDDEKDIVNLYRQILENLGYKVTTKTNGLETIKEFMKNSTSYDLVITDQTMPNITGVELAKEILAIRPDIPIILCTGYSETISHEKAIEIGIKDMILKPLTMTTIALAIRKYLDNDGSN